MKDTYLLRFVGRFVFAWTGDGAGGQEKANAGETSEVADGRAPVDEREHASELVAMAMNMCFNDDLHCRPHRTFLTARRIDIQTLGSRRADLSIFGSRESPDEGDQLLLWDVEGHDLTLPPSGKGGIELLNWKILPDLARFGDSSLDKSLLKGTPPRAVVTSRFAFASGQFAPREFQPGKAVVFAPLGHGAPGGKGNHPLPDLMDGTFELEEPLRVELKRQRDGARSSITCAPPDKPNTAVVLTVSNLCSGLGSADDLEFAAYYDVLSKPVAARDRLVPYASREPMLGPRADCTGVAQIRY